MIIYCDSDGVLSDFYGGAEQVLGHPWGEKHTERQSAIDQGLLLNKHEAFWENLPPISDWKVLWSFIEKYDPHILTAVPAWDHNFSEVEEGKWEWYQKNLPLLPRDRFHVVYREDKANFARNGRVRNLLIDDHPGNIEEFEAAGGIGIYHVSAKVTILKLKELGYH